MKLLVLTLLLLPNLVLGLGPDINAGIVRGIWYSKQPFFVGDRITVYTGVQNSSKQELRGTLEFYDNNILLEKIDFEIAKNEPLGTFGTKITATKGLHNFEARVISLVTVGVSGNQDPVSPIQISSADTQFIDTDTDGDEIGDLVDVDDDGDDYTDTAEAAAGTDPLDRFDHPGEKTASEQSIEKLRDGAVVVKDAYATIDDLRAASFVGVGAARQATLAELALSLATGSVAINASAGSSTTETASSSPANLILTTATEVLQAPTVSVWDKVKFTGLSLAAVLLSSMIGVTGFVLVLLWVFYKIARKIYSRWRFGDYEVY